MATLTQVEFTQICMFVSSHRATIENDSMTTSDLAKFIKRNKGTDVSNRQVKKVIEALGEAAPTLKEPEAASTASQIETLKTMLRRARAAIRHVVTKIDGRDSDLMKEINEIFQGSVQPESGAEDANCAQAKKPE